MDIKFSVNTYDSDGDITDNGILLHINDTFSLRVSCIEELDDMIVDLLNIKQEIVDNY